MNEYDKIRILQALRQETAIRRIGWADKCAEVGDFTYATNPRIWTWGEGSKLYIGKFCSIGANVQFLLGGEHHTEWGTTYPFNVLIPGLCDCEEKVAKTKGDIRVGNDVWIGNDATILSGVTIGDGAVIGNGAVVASDVQPYSVMIGNPARMKRWRFGRPWINELLSMRWWDWPDELLAQAIPLLCSDNIDGLIELWKGWPHE